MKISDVSDMRDNLGEGIEDLFQNQVITEVASKEIAEWLIWAGWVTEHPEDARVVEDGSE